MTEQKWTAADVSDEQAAEISELLNDEYEWDDEMRKEVIAAACDIMGVAKPAPSEWPADAPDWADRLVLNAWGTAWYYGVQEDLGRLYPTQANYSGPRPASWTGKPWQECILRRPTVATPAVDVERLAEVVVDLATAGRRGFITSESGGQDGYVVRCKFRTLEDSQAFYAALAACGSSSLVADVLRRELKGGE